MYAFRKVPRRLTTLALAATVAASALGPLAPSLFAQPIIRDHRDPDARVQVVINKVIVHDDMDWGAGEIKLRLRARVNAERCELYAATCGRVLSEGTIPQFSANDGTVKSLYRAFPTDGDTFKDDSVGPTLGIPLHGAEWAGFDVIGSEDDPTEDDDLGALQAHIVDENGQVRYGVFTERGAGRCSRSPIMADLCRPWNPAGFSVEYEIRRAPLPDLRPSAIKVYPVPGTARKSVCADVANIDVADAGPFNLSLHVDGIMTPGGTYSTTGLLAGTASPICVEVDLPPSGTHQLTAIVDDTDAVAEFNEKNNEITQPYVGTGNTPAPTPTQGPILLTGPGGAGAEAGRGQPPVVAAPSPAPSIPSGADQADLIVTSVKVNGRAPDGKDDCKDGKNTVIAGVKNAGGAKAGSFAIRLVIDGADGDALEQAVNGLDDGKEREVRFEDVRLKKGEHKLALTADAKGSVAESNDDNNGKTVTATCRDDN